MKSFEFKGVTFFKKPTAVYIGISTDKPEVYLYADTILVARYYTGAAQNWNADREKLVALIKKTFGDE